MGNMFGFSSIVTRIAPTDTVANILYSGLFIKVWGFTVSNISGGNATATIRTNETSPTTIWTAVIPTNTTVSVPIPFIADKGIQVMTSVANSLSFTFYHSQAGT
jgi:hypothetical protein